MNERHEPSFRRELPDHITASVAGVVDNVDADIMARTPARVVVELPDDVADSLAHVLARSWQITRLHGGEPDTGIDERALAETLFAAAAASGYRCPQGGLHLP